MDLLKLYKVFLGLLSNKTKLKFDQDFEQYWIEWLDLSKLLNGFLKIDTYICQSCFMCFSPFAKQNQAEV